MAPHNTISAQEDSADLVRDLELVSENIVKAWDGTYGPSSYDFLRQWCSEDYKMDWHGDYNLRLTETLDQHMMQLDVLKKVNPAWRMNAYNFTAVLDREGTAAMVMFTSGMWLIAFCTFLVT